MSNTMCGISSASVSAQIPTTNNAAAEKYVNVIKRVANNDTISIRETVKWLITATESLNLSLMHDTLSRIAVQHEKRVNGILKGLEHSYPDMTKDDSQMPVKAVFLQYLMSEKKEALEEIMNALVYSLTISNICDLHHHMLGAKPIEEDNSVTMDTIAKLHDYIGKKAASEFVSLNPSNPTADAAGQLLGEKIKANVRFFQEQTKEMDKQRSLTIDELGCNFRRLSDYCDKLEQVLKADHQVPQQQVKACEQTPGCGFNQQCTQPQYHAPVFPPISKMSYSLVHLPPNTNSASTDKSAASNSHPASYDAVSNQIKQALLIITNLITLATLYPYQDNPKKMSQMITNAKGVKDEVYDMAIKVTANPGLPVEQQLEYVVKSLEKLKDFIDPTNLTDL